MASVLLVVMGLATGAPAVEPSEDADRRGSYTVVSKTDKRYHYVIRVPESYDPHVGAGIHLYFHGQNGQGGADHFGQWRGAFLDGHNLIGINMKYTDGDNASDTAGKVQAAVEALAQVQADYSIVVGRGVISSFSGGGLPHAMLFQQAARRGPNQNWPFSHMAMYGSNYRGSVRTVRGMSWYIGVGGKEWNMAGLGSDGSARARERFGMIGSGGSMEVTFLVLPDKGHKISGEDVKASAAAFGRYDLAFNPLVAESAYEDSPLRSVVHQINRLQLAAARTALDGVEADEATEAPTRERVKALRGAIDQRLERIVETAALLAQNDPVLYEYYRPHWQRQVRRTDAEAELEQIHTGYRQASTHPRAKAGFGAFLKLMNDLPARADPNISADYKPTLEKLQAMLGEQSVHARMLEQWIKLATK